MWTDAESGRRTDVDALLVLVAWISRRAVERRLEAVVLPSAVLRWAAASAVLQALKVARAVEVRLATAN